MAQVLIAHREAAIRRTLARRLGESVETIEVSEGEAVGALCALRPPDCVLLGSRLADGSALDVVRMLRGPSRITLVPIVVLLDAASPELDVAVRNLGAQECLVEREATRPMLRLAIRTAIERHQLRTALRAAEEKFRTVLEVSPDPITVTRLADGRFVEVNEPFVRLTGYQRREAIGRRPTDLRLWANPEQHEAGMRDLESRRLVREVPALFRTRDGRVIEGKISAAVVTLDAEPSILSFVRVPEK